VNQVDEQALIRKVGAKFLNWSSAMNEQQTLRLFAWVFGGLVVTIFALIVVGMPQV
jgi:hypothetical protein